MSNEYIIQLRVSKLSIDAGDDLKIKQERFDSFQMAWLNDPKHLISSCQFLLNEVILCWSFAIVQIAAKFRSFF